MDYRLCTQCYHEPFCNDAIKVHCSYGKTLCPFISFFVLSIRLIFLSIYSFFAIITHSFVPVKTFLQSLGFLNNFIRYLTSKNSIILLPLFMTSIQRVRYSLYAHHKRDRIHHSKSHWQLFFTYNPETSTDTLLLFSIKTL